MSAQDKSTNTEIEFSTNVQTMEQQHDASKPSSKKLSSSTSTVKSRIIRGMKQQLNARSSKSASSSTSRAKSLRIL